MAAAKRRRRVNATGRSIGADRHVRLHHWLMRTDAWQRLSLAGRCLLVELYALYNGSNNGQLFLSVRDAATKLGAGKNRAHAAFRELQDKGFIQVHVPGAFHRKVRHATAWRLTEFGCGNALATRDFTRWRDDGP